MVALQVLVAVMHPRALLGAVLILTLGACNVLLDNDPVDEVSASPVDQVPPPATGQVPATSEVPTTGEVPATGEVAPPTVAAVQPDAAAPPASPAGAYDAGTPPLPKGVDVCRPNPCGLGTCTVVGNDASCACPAGFGGSSCGTYSGQLKNVNSQLCLDVAMPTAAGPPRVVQQACSQQTGQVWHLARESDGYGTLRHQQTGKCVRLEKLHVDHNQLRATLAVCDAQDGHQRWSVVPESAGKFGLKNKERASCLAIQDESPAANAVALDVACGDMPGRTFQ